MIRVTVDIFSGRPNPTWIVTNDASVRKLLAAVAKNPKMAGKPGAGFQGLGFRGVEVELIGDDDEIPSRKIPGKFVLASGAGAYLREESKLAASLMKEMTRYSDIVMPEHQLTSINQEMQELLLKSLAEFVKNPPKIPRRPEPPPPPNPLRRTIKDDRCERCQYEISVYNPAFWNSDPTVRWNNNCYNYARNWRTNTFAQPGRASGSPIAALNCAAVSKSARSDGLVDRCQCLPQTEWPRRLMALVISPGSDYHWYRHQIGGFWGHKPGHTAARNTDNSSVIIANPETCNRGPYTDFCGYFYAGKSVKII